MVLHETHAGEHGVLSLKKMPPGARHSIGASDAKKRDPEVFRREILDPPPHPPGGYGLSKEENCQSARDCLHAHPVW